MNETGTILCMSMDWWSSQWLLGNPKQVFPSPSKSFLIWDHDLNHVNWVDYIWSCPRWLIDGPFGMPFVKISDSHNLLDIKPKIFLGLISPWLGNPYD